MLRLARRLACALSLAFLSLPMAFARAGAQECVAAAALANDKGGCARNPSPDPIPAGLGGTTASAATCMELLDYALAAMYAYDGNFCRRKEEAIADNLKYLGDATEYFPDEYRTQVSARNFFASLYCIETTNTLVLSFRGSVTPTVLPNDVTICDWWSTNLIYHLGDRPLQYQYSADLTQELVRAYNAGELDGHCGKGRPNLALTGHSKGGGQAQYAGIRWSRKVIVFNSDAANPIIFIDPIIEHQSGWLEFFELFLRSKRSIDDCRRAAPLYNRYAQYYQNGGVRDIRMVNDPLVRLFTTCSFAHAPMEWLIDTTTCSRDNGHSMASVIRELRSCSAG